MSGNASRKHKEYMLMQKRKKLFGNISPKMNRQTRPRALWCITGKSRNIGRMIVKN